MSNYYNNYDRQDSVEANYAGDVDMDNVGGQGGEQDQWLDPSADIEMGKAASETINTTSSNNQQQQ